jgi:hypothetical protein
LSKLEKYEKPAPAFAPNEKVWADVLDVPINRNKASNARVNFFVFMMCGFRVFVNS